MKINNQEVDVSDLVKEDLHKNLHKLYGKDIYISDNDREVLRRYDFDINKYNDVKSLIFDITDYLDDSVDSDLDDLENVVNSLSEFNYYHNTNK